MLSIEHCLLRLRGMPPLDTAVDRDRVDLDGEWRHISRLQVEPAASTTVYGTLLNYRRALAALGDGVHAAPYKAPPRAPVLYIKPANTWAAHGSAVEVPSDAAELEVGPALAVVIGRTACRVGVESALDHVAGYTIANDVSVPHASYYRPSIREKCRDGFLPIGPWVTARQRVGNADNLGLRVFVDGELRQHNNTANLIRPVARLIAELTDFMTLVPGDVLLTGVPEGAPRVRAGQTVAIEIDGLGRLENRFVAAGQSAERAS
jgi:5-oxopent-3-ene-1,2,5-tricarboxylate decarboxylase/2-hydroxyhepta-2,4-diene-1,7-dioate isomerase